MPKRIGYLKSPHAASLPSATKAYEARRARREQINWYTSARWRRARAAKLRQAPLCEDCRRQGRVTQASHVHHVQPREQRPDLAYDQANLESLCQPCHNAKDVR